MKQEKNKKKKAGIRSVAFISLLVIGILFAYMTFPHPQLIQDEKGWRIIFDGNLAQAAEGDPGVGASGILEIFFVNHSSNDYASENDSSVIEGWCDAHNLGYANADDFNVELAHTVSFDIAIKVRVNKTHAWDGSKFIDSWVRMNLTSADLGIGADTAMEKSVLTNNSGDNFIWLMFYYDFSDSGDTLSKDQSADITSIKLQAYY